MLDAPHPAPPVSPPMRVLAALGPKMLRLAATRAAGAHTYLSPVAHTAWARAEMGDGPLLVPSLKVVLERDAGEARDIGRRSVGPALRMPAYSGNLARFGLDTSVVSDDVVDALVAWGDPDAIADRVRAHLGAGADHVCIEVLTGDDTTVPLSAWTELAPALLAIA